MRNIKLMADYECFAIWDEDTVDNLNPDDLPISDNLKLKIHQWEETFDATLNRSDPANSGFSGRDDLRQFDEEGLKLWQQLRQELGDEYLVRYFSHLNRKVFDS